MKKPLAALIIVFCVAAAYLPALRNGFVWDDTALILRDPLIRSWRLIPESFNHFLFVDATASDFYRPVQRLTYTLEYGLFAFNPIAYHVDSILLHAAAAVALFFLIEELLGLSGVAMPARRWTSLVAALAWSIHPVQSAAVAYVSGRADPLAALFGFAGCYVLLRASRTKSPASLLLSVLSALLLLLSALSKESGLVFGAMALLLASWFNGRPGFVRAATVALVVVVTYLTLRLPAEHHPIPHTTTAPGALTRPITMARGIAEYAGLIVFPLNLHMEREVNPRPQTDPDAAVNPFAFRELQTLLGVAILAVLIAWAVYARHRSPAICRLLLLTAVSYLPISGLFSLNASVAEHWLYVPTAFLFAALALELQGLLTYVSATRFIRSALTVSVAAWALFLGLRTAIRTFDWKDQRTFVEKTIADGGDSARMWINLAGLELAENHLDLAKSDLLKALSLEPEQPLAILNLAVVALRQKDFKAAGSLAHRALNMPWVEAQAHELLAVLEFQEKGVANPMRLRLASRTGNPNWEIEERYVRLLDETGATDSAIHELKTCLKSEWYRAETWDLLGCLLHKRGNEREAQLAQSIAIDYDVHLDQHKVRL